MHIIKITPKSFKIILSKEDLQRYGAENIFENKELSDSFFAEIIEETNSLYGNPFSEGSIDAEFFESKNGGGELFISKHPYENTDTTYLFTSHDSELLSKLCKRLNNTMFSGKSSLFSGENNYKLILWIKETDTITKAIIREYGKLKKINKLELWQTEEHNKEIFHSDAVRLITERL